MAFWDWFNGTRNEFPQPAAPAMFNPEDQRRAAISQMLIQAGQQFGQAPNLLGGLSAGLGGAAQGALAGRQDYRQGVLEDFKLQEAQTKMEQQKRQQELWASLFPTAGAPTRGMASPAGTVRTPGSPQYASAGGPTPGLPVGAPQTSTNPMLAGMTPDKMSILAMLGPEAGIPLLAEQAFQSPTEQWSPMSPQDEIAQFGRDLPGSYFASSLGNPPKRIEGSAPDTLSPEAEAQKLRIADAGRSISNTTTVVNPAGVDNPLMDVWKGGITSLQERVSSQADLRPRVEQIIGALESGVETGKVEEALMPLRQWAADLGWADNPGLSQQEALRSAISYIIPRMRVTGSGATSDLEIKMFSQATAQMGNTPAGNLIIARGMLQIMDSQQRALDAVYSASSDTNFTIQDANKKIQEQLGQIFPKPKTEEEYNAIPPGTVYLHPQNGWSVKR